MYVLCMKPSQNRKNVLSDISFCNVLSEHHSSLNLTTTPHYVLVDSEVRGTTLQKLIVVSGGTECTTLQKLIVKVKVSESIFGPLNRLKISEAEVFT